MQRYFVNEENMTNSEVTITGADYKHITRVIRLKQGDHIICCDGSRTARCVLKDMSNQKVTADIIAWIEEDHELPVAVTIAQGLPKADKLDYIVQKGTEMGTADFLPFTAQRSIVKWTREKIRKKTERLQKIAKEAAEQSHRNRIPAIYELASFNDVLQASSHYDIKIVAYEEAAKTGEMAALSATLKSVKAQQSLLFVAGPEGGLTEQEVNRLQERGFVVCGLGPRILRTETAPLYFLAAVSYQTELLR